MSKRRGFGFMKNNKPEKSLDELADNIIEEQSDYQEDELQYAGEQYEEGEYTEAEYTEGYSDEQYSEQEYENQDYEEQPDDEQMYTEQQYVNSAYVDPQYMNPRYANDPSYTDPNFSKTNYLPQLNIDESMEYQDGQGSFDGFSGRYGDYDEYGISDYMDDGFNEYSEYDEDYEQYGESYEEYEDQDYEDQDYEDGSGPKKDVITTINDWVASNKIICFTVLGAILIIAIVLFVIAKLKSGGEVSVSSNSSNAASDNEVAGTYIPQDPLLINNYPEVNEIVNKYFSARQSYDMDTINVLRDYADPLEAAKLEAMSYYVESYNDITCYTKPGPFENSYLTYITYNVKLYEWEQVAPALLTFLICTKDDGSLYIYSGDFDENVESYIAAVSAQDDVVDLITRINAEYKEVLDSDENFNDYMSEFNEQIREKVKERLAAIKMEEDAANQDTAEQSPEEIKELITFEVQATDTVNVRASDSEDADRVGRVEAGTILTCYEQRTNGWSQVEYEGEIAYIKSDYLINLSSNDTSSEDVIGTVKAKETVNIRGKDSTDGRQLGVAYMGDTFDLIENQSNGWSKIIYNGMVAYIKTEYLE